MLNPDPEFDEMISISIIKGLIETGVLDPDQMTPKKMSQVLTKLSYSADFVSVIDYRPDIARIAAQHAKKGNKEVSVVLYAAWVEHSLNSLIERAGTRKGLTGPEICKIIWTNIEAKISWVPKLLDLPPMSTAFVAKILKLAEARNAFVHYKWAEKKMDDDSYDYNLNSILDGVPALRRYLVRYERRALLRGHDPKTVARAIKADVASRQVALQPVPIELSA